MTENKHCYCIEDNELDDCLGMLPGLANACCGHNDEKSAYVQFLDGSCVRGKNAIIIQDILKKDVETDWCADFLNYKIKDFEISKSRSKAVK